MKNDKRKSLYNAIMEKVANNVKNAINEGAYLQFSKGDFSGYSTEDVINWFIDRYEDETWADESSIYNELEEKHIVAFGSNIDIDDDTIWDDLGTYKSEDFSNEEWKTLLNYGLTIYPESYHNDGHGYMVFKLDILNLDPKDAYDALMYINNLFN